MAKLSATFLKNAPTVGSSLPRVKDAGTVADTLSACVARLDALTIIDESVAAQRPQLTGIILSGGRDSNGKLVVMRGKDGFGKEHYTFKTQFAVASPADVAKCKAEMALLQTPDAVRARYYEFLDNHILKASVWPDDSIWATCGNGGTFTGRVGFATEGENAGTLNVKNLMHEKPALSVAAKQVGQTATAVTATATPTVVYRQFGTEVLSEAEILAKGIPAAVLATFPVATAPTV